MWAGSQATGEGVHPWELGLLGQGRGKDRPGTCWWGSQSAGTETNPQRNRAHFRSQWGGDVHQARELCVGHLGKGGPCLLGPKM